MKKYGKDKPFNDGDLFDDMYEIAGDPELPAFVEKYIEGTQELPLKKTLRQVGLDLDTETGKISEMLTGAATYYEEEVDQKTKNLSTIIELILMIIIGIGVGFFAISMLAPTYSLVDYIG